MQSKTWRIALYGMCIALAFVLSYVEALFPIQGAMPGMKLGLTNLVVLFALYFMNDRAAFAINMIRILLVAVTFGNFFSLFYSLAGGMLSFLAMFLLKRIGGFQIVTVSVTGSVFHNAGQILMAMVLLGTKQVTWYFGVLSISGIVSGAVIGLLAGIVVSRLQHTQI